MTKSIPFATLVAPIAILITTAIAYPQSEIVVTASRDNTLYEDAQGALSNGAGPFIYAGKRRDGLRRRALIRFDLDGQVPAGARVQAATLQLHLSNANPASGPQEIRIHRVNADWGEGTSNAGTPGGAGAPATPGDATWIHTFFDTTSWTTPGGDFSASPSASATVDGNGFYTWSSAELADDVQAWLDNPDSNFGWAVLGNETANLTAKRFDSRQNNAQANHPTLTLELTGVTSVAEASAGPQAIELKQNYPNPFNPETVIRYTIATGTTSPVRLDIFNLLGQRVRTLVARTQQAGSYSVQWDGRASDGQPLPSGIYLYRLSVGGLLRTNSMTLLR